MGSGESCNEHMESTIISEPLYIDPNYGPIEKVVWVVPCGLVLLRYSW